MLWIGAIFGALFGWIGILVVALFWVTLAIFKLIGAILVFGIQLLLWTGAFVYQGVGYLANRLGGTKKVAPPELTPRRTRRRK